MEIEIDSKKNNPLLKRTEVYFTVKHAGEGTPNRELIRSELADKLNSKKENIIVNIMKPGFGIHETTGYAKVYSSPEKSKGLEKEHILKRNKIGETKKDKKEAKTSEAPAGETSAPKNKPAEPETQEVTPEADPEPVNEEEKEPVAEPESEEKPEDAPTETASEEQVDETPKEAAPEPAVEETPAETNQEESQPEEEKPVEKESKEESDEKKDEKTEEKKE